MGVVIQAACGCDTGKIRKNNEDNFFFGQKYLEQENHGLEQVLKSESRLGKGLLFAVLDGIGGENCGETASFAAAQQMQQLRWKLQDQLIPVEDYIERAILQLNDAVVKKQKEMCTERMGTTLAGLFFTRRFVCVYNVGDSRAYRFRNGELVQMSVDHVEKSAGRLHKKAPLTQYLGYGSEEMQLEPYITKERIVRGDLYLVCSDGLTDMLTDSEISKIIIENNDVSLCVQKLIEAALEHGGRDNITAIICRIL